MTSVSKVGGLNLSFRRGRRSTCGDAMLFGQYLIKIGAIQPEDWMNRSNNAARAACCWWNEARSTNPSFAGTLPTILLWSLQLLRLRVLQPLSLRRTLQAQPNKTWGNCLEALP